MIALVLIGLWFAALGGWWAIGRGLGGAVRPDAVALTPSDEPTG